MDTANQGRADALLIDAEQIPWDLAEVATYKSEKSRVIAWMRQGARLARLIDVGVLRSHIDLCKEAYGHARSIAFENQLFDLALDAQRAIRDISSSTGMAGSYDELEAHRQAATSVWQVSSIRPDARLAEEAAVDAIEFPECFARKPLQKCASGARYAAARGCLVAERSALQVLADIARLKGNNEIAALSAVLSGSADKVKGVALAEPSFRAVRLVRAGHALSVRVAAAEYIAMVGSIIPEEDARLLFDDLLQLATTRISGHARPPYVAGQAAIAAIAGSLTSQPDRDKVVLFLTRYGTDIASTDRESFAVLCKWAYRWCISPTATAELDCWLLGLAVHNLDLSNIVKNLFVFRLNHFGGRPREVLSELRCVVPEGFASGIRHMQDDRMVEAQELLLSIRASSAGGASIPAIESGLVKCWTLTEKCEVTDLLINTLRNSSSNPSQPTLSSLLAVADEIHVDAAEGSDVLRRLKALVAGSDLNQRELMLVHSNVVEAGDDLGPIMGALLRRLFSNESADNQVAAECLERLWIRNLDLLRPNDLMNHQNVTIRLAAIHELIVRGTIPDITQHQEVEIRLMAAKHASLFPDTDFAADPDSLVRFTAKDENSQCKSVMHRR